MCCVVWGRVDIWFRRRGLAFVWGLKGGEIMVVFLGLLDGTVKHFRVVWGR
ncbi:hypothetical protein MNL08_07045 [Bartonella krasnovii]|uniref:hypothetical protein n=1 Tax=Bartonella krasnovii TaxID=2267275 RepID=UPI001F4CB3B8|nr:hypothetical protein [Bartonella krasnovii]UNF36835.1 hypothetical protein MNL11_07090 [Bartonella krasnovii]UNF41913.1 hypothetical protein MNL08_07045 [Bartonella krasnovii]